MESDKEDRERVVARSLWNLNYLMKHGFSVGEEYGVFSVKHTADMANEGSWGFDNQ